MYSRSEDGVSTELCIQYFGMWPLSNTSISPIIPERVVHDSYTYTSQLLAEESCKPVPDISLPVELPRFTTRAKIRGWEEALASHPDRQFATYIKQEFMQGFCIGFEYGKSLLGQEHSNMKISDPQAVTAYLANELVENRLVQMSATKAEAKGIHCSPMGLIPKRTGLGKWCLIVDLSFPVGASVNDRINKELCSLSYVSVDAVAKAILQTGRGTLMAKMDIKQAYHTVPVHPADYVLLGMRWDDKVHKSLPFGLRSASLIFSARVNALAWIMRQRDVTFVGHYIDDFITLGRPRSDECQANQRAMLET